jgi:cation diffusion facilitator family transporter
VDGDDNDLGDLTHATPAYRRVLWTVLLLNIGYGLVEIGGGFLAGSQSLKADALDFLGDGTITLLGVLAIGWGAVWRARAALLQGLFLALLGVLVFAFTIYRLLVLRQLPEADLMGVFGVGGLIVNLLSAFLLLRHRHGDANVQAVWHFSRNDAIGNVAVVVAASLVWLTATSWPDLIVALAIAGLFLQSAWKIIAAALRELAEISS